MSKVCDLNCLVQIQQHLNSSSALAAGTLPASYNVNSWGFTRQHAHGIVHLNGLWIEKKVWPAPSLNAMSNFRWPGQHCLAQKSLSSFAFNIGANSDWARKCASHVSGNVPLAGSGIAPAGMGVMWYRFLVSHPVNASKTSTRCWMYRPSIEARKPKPASCGGIADIC